MKITTVLFDLDGTLTDSGPGIMNSVKYALEKVGEPTPDVDELRKFIGPPLKGQFMEHCGIDEEKAAEMVTLYREYFTVTGIFENSVYDGVEEMLKTLKQAGIKIAMATSKPEKFAKIIADHFGLAQYFDVIGGACMDETRTEKQDVIRYVLEQCEEKELDKIVMVGDRSYDVVRRSCGRAESDRCSIRIWRFKRTLRGRCRCSGNNTTGSSRTGSGNRIK